MLPENADERRMFDSNAELLGGPLFVVANALEIMHAVAPVGGSYREQLAIMANEIRKALPAPAAPEAKE